jgi:hypothetical protein
MAQQSTIPSRIVRIKSLASERAEPWQLYEAAGLAQSVVYDTAGRGHPSYRAIDEATKSGDWTRILGACNSVVVLYEQGGLASPTLRIAHEIEGDLLEIAVAQARAAEAPTDPFSKQLGLAIAAFLAGAALEDALRRLCDAAGVPYDVQRSSLSKLQGALYQPSAGIEVISVSEVKQITTWGDVRNKADHGKFSELTQTEVVTMLMGVRAFIDKHLP